MMEMLMSFMAIAMTWITGRMMEMGHFLNTQISSRMFTTPTQDSVLVIPVWLSLPLGTHTNYNIGVVPELISEIFMEAGVPARDSSLPGTKESLTIMLTGGTAVSLAVAWKQMNTGKYDDAGLVELSMVEFEKLHDWVFGFYNSGAERELALPPERIKLFASGTALTKEFVRALGAEKMTITARDLRWGVVLGEGITERGYLADEQESPDSR